MFELFDHTADLGLRVTATDLNGLFAEAARGLFSMIVENPDDVEPRVERTFRIEGADPAYLLFDWLAELLYAFDATGLLLSRFEVVVGAAGLEATAWGEPCDAERHRLDHEVKAITYHGLFVRRTRDGWEAEVVVDI